MNTSENTILNYNLFGESGDLPDVVHCETIEARSRLHDWEFSPHRHARLHQVLILEKGRGKVSLDGRNHPIPPASIVNVPVGIVHGFSFEPGTRGLVITLAAEILDDTLRHSKGLGQILNQPTVQTASSDIASTMQSIAICFAGRDFARAHVLRALCALLIGQIAQSLFHSGSAPEASQKPELLSRFETLIEDKYLLHWTVAEYAAALSVSPTHLSRVTRAATGRPATRLIEERLIREARRNLVYTNLPVSTIAYALGFEDPAYFSRVFSRATGLAPRNFRARALSDAAPEA
ncbi:helix-turn-helix domain-containing protein [Shimia sp.]|uniref:helix-turn-helix domain-containing protein n=1 Tax=Shimia sp. TaxID=1954381 RepID=UPI0032997B15